MSSCKAIFRVAAGAVSLTAVNAAGMRTQSKLTTAFLVTDDVKGVETAEGFVAQVDSASIEEGQPAVTDVENGKREDAKPPNTFFGIDLDVISNAMDDFEQSIDYLLGVRDEKSEYGRGEYEHIDGDFDSDMIHASDDAKIEEIVNEITKATSASKESDGEKSINDETRVIQEELEELKAFSLEQKIEVGPDAQHHDQLEDPKIETTFVSSGFSIQQEIEIENADAIDEDIENGGPGTETVPTDEVEVVPTPTQLRGNPDNAIVDLDAFSNEIVLIQTASITLGNFSVLEDVIDPAACGQKTAQSQWGLAGSEGDESGFVDDDISLIQKFVDVTEECGSEFVSLMQTRSVVANITTDSPWACEEGNLYDDDACELQIKYGHQKSSALLNPRPNYNPNFADEHLFTHDDDAASECSEWGCWFDDTLQLLSDSVSASFVSV